MSPIHLGCGRNADILVLNLPLPGAVFISTLAAEQLPEPHSPPEGQTEFLAASIQPIVAFMVLCSIAVHGLSIPFFTFGRRVHSVSRTWSRHNTLETHGSRRRTILPEWTTQIRHVQPGEEIVINRDEREDSLTPVAGTSSEEEKHAEDSPRGSAAVTMAEKEDTPPDGTETYQEWREGPHKVIERREGPGMEVSSSHFFPLALAQQSRILSACAFDRWKWRYSGMRTTPLRR